MAYVPPRARSALCASLGLALVLVAGPWASTALAARPAAPSIGSEEPPPEESSPDRRAFPRVEVGLHGGAAIGGGWSRIQTHGSHEDRRWRPLGGLSVGVVLSETFAVELGGIVPWQRGHPGQWDRGFARPLTARAEAAWDLAATARFTPVSATFERSAIDGFDVFAVAGIGLIRTHDDPETVGCSSAEDSACARTLRQTHPTATVGLGARIRWTPALSTRLEARTVRYVETFKGDALAAQSPLLLLVGLTAVR